MKGERERGKIERGVATGRCVPEHFVWVFLCYVFIVPGRFAFERWVPTLEGGMTLYAGIG
jgi:hypothetical protein